MNLFSTLSPVHDTLVMSVNVYEKGGYEIGDLGSSCPANGGEECEEPEGRWLGGL